MGQVSSIKKERKEAIKDLYYEKEPIQTLCRQIKNLYVLVADTSCKDDQIFWANFAFTD